MNLVRRTGVPRKYQNPLKGSGDNNSNSFELEKIRTKERLVVYDKTEELSQHRKPIIIENQVIRVEYKMSKELWKNVITKNIGMIDVLDLWLDVADEHFKQCLDEIYLPGVHYKNQTLVNMIEKNLKDGNRKMTVRSQQLFEKIADLLNSLRTYNQYHQIIRKYVQSSANRDRWERIQKILSEINANPIVIAADAPFDGFQGVRDRVYVMNGWQ